MELPLRLFDDASGAARAAAAFIASEARAAVEARGRFVLALSGGRTPWEMARALTLEDVPWDAVHVVQVDERVAPGGDGDRNLTFLSEIFLERAFLPPAHLHAMPVEDLEEGAARYARELEEIAGSPPVLDLAHLGLGADGHTASLAPGDPVLHVTDRDVAMTQPYQGRRRMTLTFPVLGRARRIVWLVTGAEKAAALARLVEGDEDIPAGRVARERAVVMADGEAAGRAVSRPSRGARRSTP